ncbi:MAG: hypothetical protein ACRDFS_08310 [Chloroflexota bacterium]
MGLRDLYRRQIEREQGQSSSGAHLREATTEDWYWGRLGGTEEDYYWRRLSDNWTEKDVLPGTYLEIHNQVYEAYNANPMANAIVEMGVNFVLGEGLTYQAASKRVQRLLDAFWNDPDNHMPLRQYELATELSLYGEIFIRCFVNPFDGHLKIALLDPSLVDEIACDPNNIEKQLRVHRRGVMPETETGPDVMAGAWYAIPDDILHFAINKVSNAKRGKSDLATLLPWLRRYKDWLIDRVRINKYKAAFLWDVTLTGADRKTIEAKMMEYGRPPEPGSLIIHNESETWAAVQPNINSQDAAADGQAIKLMVAMGAGLPEHFLSDGGDVNRATAAEMGLPTLKRFERRQDYLTHILRTLFDRVIDEARKAGSLPQGTDASYEIHFPRLQTEDDDAIGASSWHMAQSLNIMHGLGLISDETAIRIYAHAAREDLNPADELAASREL